MKNQKGITLVALVVTIVVLLILAGVSIAMLAGDNGIITNAQKSDAANTEGEVIDRMNFAYNTVKAEVVVQSSLNADYDATEHIDEFIEMINKELGGTEDEAPAGYTVEEDGTTNGQINIKYTDGRTFKDGGTYQPIQCSLTIEADDVTYEQPERRVIVLTTDGGEEGGE